MVYRKQNNPKLKTTALVASAVLATGVAAGYTLLNDGDASADVAVSAVTQDDSSLLLVDGGGRGRGGSGGVFGGRGGHGDLSDIDPNTVPEVELVPTPELDATTENDSLVPEADEEPLIVEGAVYKDGQYYGESVPADRWGNMQVVAVIEEGELVDVLIADYPRSTMQSDLITRNALPTLISEAIEAQSAEIDIVTRATDSSVAFIASLEAALDDAAVETAVEDTVPASSPLDNPA